MPKNRKIFGTWISRMQLICITVSYSVLFISLINTTYASDNKQNDCQISVIADISGSIDAIWETAEIVIPGEECCGMPGHFNCFELIVLPHSDARAFEVEFESTIGELYYVVNCEGVSQTVPPSKTVRICLDGTGDAISLIFCRPGSPQYQFTVRSLVSGVDISFPELDPVCADAEPVVLNQAIPAGGNYFINNQADPVSDFDPATWGVGEHTITYLYTDANNGCEGFAEQTITVNPNPEINCGNLQVCENEAPFSLYDAFPELPTDGVYTVEGVPVTEFDPFSAGAGDHTIQYHYVIPESGCGSNCDIQIEVLPMPQVHTYTALLCDPNGLLVVDNVDITSYESFLTSDDEVSFAYFSDPQFLSPIVNPQSATILVDDTIWVKVNNLGNGCINTTFIIFEFITHEPIDYSVSLCSQTQGLPPVVNNFDPTPYQAIMFAGTAETIYEWFVDAAHSIPLTIPVPQLLGGNHELYLKITDKGCQAGASLHVQINPLPVINCGNDPASVCQSNEPIDLEDIFAALPAEGVFYVNGQPATQFTPSMAGSFSILFILEDPSSQCVSLCVLTIEVVALPQLTSPVISICDDDGDGEVAGVDLTQYESDFTTENISISWYLDENHTQPISDPTSVTITNGLVYYITGTNISGCISNAEITFNLDILTVSDVEIELCDTPGGELAYLIFETALYNHEIHSPQPGLTFTWYENAALTQPAPAIVAEILPGTVFWVMVARGSCEEIVLVSFEINPLPVVTCPAATIDVCRNDPPISLAGLSGISPAGGSFSGPGVSAGIFNPAGVVAGSHTLQYSYQNSETGCIATCSFSVDVSNPPEVSNHVVELCNALGNSSIDLTQYNSDLSNTPDITFQYFDDEEQTLNIPNPLSHIVFDQDTIFVSIEGINGCAETAWLIFDINTSLELTDQAQTLCDESVSGLLQAYDVDLSAFNPAFYSGNAVADFQWFTDAALTNQIESPVPIVSNNDVFYIVVTVDECIETAQLTIEVKPLPTLDCDLTIPDFCLLDEPANLRDITGQLDSDFTGPGITNNIFDPLQAGVGVHTISQQATDENNCFAECTFDITVVQSPELNCPDTLYFCAAGGLRELNQSLPAGGIYTGDGVVESAGTYYFDPSLTGVGIFPIIYTYTSGGCSNSCIIEVDVLSLPDFACNRDKEVCEDSEPFILDELCPLEGTFEGPGVSYNETEDHYLFDPSVAGTGTHDITHVFTHPLSLLDYVCVFPVVVNPLPLADCSAQDKELCQNTGSIILADEFSPQPDGGNFYLNNVEIDEFPTDEPGIFELEYVYTDLGTNCLSSCTFLVTITPAPDADNITIDVCGNPGTVIINLNEFTDQINPSTDVSFEFFEDAALLIPLTNATSHSPQPGETIFVVVISPEGCETVATLEFDFKSIDIEDHTIAFCDQSTDGSLAIYDLQLNTLNDTIYVGVADFTWFTDPSLLPQFEVETVETVNNGDIFYLVVSLFDCEFVAEVEIHVKPLPPLQCNDTLVCNYAGSINLFNLVNLEGGTFSGNWITDGIFDVQQAGSGIHSYEYNYLDANGCSAVCEANIEVYYPGTLTCIESFTACLNEGLVPLGEGIPAGGTYSGVGVSQIEGLWYFNTLVAGAGNHEIAYTVNALGCGYSCSFEVNITNLPAVTCPPNLVFCEGDDDINLSQLIYSPSGGEFSGPHVSRIDGEYIFHTNQATTDAYFITYRFPDPNTGCYNECSFVIKINPAPVIDWIGNLEFCSNEPATNLSVAAPQGGSYISPYISGENTFDFQLAGAGVHPISYTYTTLNGCTQTRDTLLTVHQAPTADAGDDLFIGQCSIANLEGNATDGTGPYIYSWSPAAILDDPGSSTTTTYPLGGTTNFRLLVTDQNGCEEMDEMTVHADGGEAITILPLNQMCENDEPVELKNASPAGGNYFINNGIESVSVFNPSLTGAGEHFLYYIYEIEEGCFFAGETIVTVLPLPSIIWNGEEFCAQGGDQLLTLALPSGGFFSGEYVTQNSFNTDISPAGEHQTSYTFTDSLGCTAIAEASVTINPLPNGNAGPDQTIPLGTYTTLSGILIDEGSFTFNWSPTVFIVSPQHQQTFTRELLYSQEFTLEITNVFTSCSISDEMLVLIEGGDPAMVYVFSEPTPSCMGDSVTFKTLVSGGLPPYQFQWYDEDPAINPMAVHLNPNLSNREFTFIPAPETTYYLKATDQHGNELFSQITPLINPLPVVEFNLPTLSCFDTSLDLSSMVEPEGGSFFIDMGEGITGNLPFNPFPVFNTADLGEGLFNLGYEYTDQNGCSTITLREIDVVHTQPDFTIAQPDICQPHILEIENNTAQTAPFKWSFEENPFNTPDDTNESNFTHTYPQLTETETYTITLDVLHPVCPASISQQVEVEGRPQPDFIVPANGCSPYTVALEDASLGNNIQQYQWGFSDGTSSFGQNPVKTFKNHTANDQTETISLTIASVDYQCFYTNEKSFTVYPETKPSFSIDKTDGCSPLEIEFTDHSSNASWVQLQWGDGSGFTYKPAEAENIYTHTYENTGSVADTLTIVQIVWLQRDEGQVCAKQDSLQVIVYPAPQAIITASDEPLADDFWVGCSPYSLNLGGDSSTNAVSWNWDTGDGNSISAGFISHTFYNTGNDPIDYTVTLTVASENGCTDDSTITVRVLPAIQAAFSQSNFSSCGTDTITFYNITPPVEDLIWHWDFGNGTESIDLNPQVMFENETDMPVTYLIHLTVSHPAGCIDQAWSTLVVYPQPQIGLITEPTPVQDIIAGCVPLSVNFDTTVPENALFPFWDFGDGNITTGSVSTTHTYHLPGSYQANFSISGQGNCIAEKSLTIEVLPKPLVEFSTDVTQGCSPLDLTLNYLFEPDPGTAYYLQTGVGNSFQAFAPEELPGSIFFANGTDIPIIETLTLRAISQFGCEAQFSKNIDILPTPGIDILFSNENNAGDTTELCAPALIEFRALPEKPDLSYSWRVNGEIEGSESVFPYHFHYANQSTAIEYEIVLTATNAAGCSDIDTLVIILHPTPSAMFTIPGDTICHGELVEFLNQSSTGESYTWNFGDGNTSNEANPDHTFTNFTSAPITHAVTIEVTGEWGCNSVYSREITVLPAFEPAFTTDIANGCSPLLVNITNHTTGPASALVYNWDYGDGQSSSTTDSHFQVFNNPDPVSDLTFLINLSVSYDGYCSKSYSSEINVLATPHIELTADIAQGCAPLDVQFSHSGAGWHELIWEMGDGNSHNFTDPSFVHTFQNMETGQAKSFTTIISAINPNGCIARDSIITLVFPEVTADFTPSVTEGCSPLIVSLSHMASGDDQYNWTFTDGNSSNTPSPDHTFTHPGGDAPYTFGASLMVTSHFGCEAVNTQEITVLPSPVSHFVLSGNSGCSGFSPAITNLSTGAEQYQWEMGDGTEATSIQPQHTWINQTGEPAAYSVLLIAENGWGCSDHSTQNITVFPEITAIINLNESLTEGCSPLNIAFNGIANGATQWFWSFGNGDSSSSQNPRYQFDNLTNEPTTFDVELIVGSPYGCADSAYMQITVLPEVKADFVVTPRRQTYPETTIQIINQYPNTNWNYRWDMGDGHVLETYDANFTHTYALDPDDLSTRKFYLQLEAYNDYCQNQKTDSVVITSPAPIPLFINPEAGCTPYTVNLESQVDYAHSYKWDFGDGTNSNQQNPQHTFYHPGNYTITLTAQGDGGSNSFSQVIKVIQSPVAWFEMANNLVFSSESVQLTNLSQGATEYFWEFGDGGTSDLFEPQYVFPEPGLYTITLTALVHDETTCSDTYTSENSLRVQDACILTFPNAFAPDPGGSSGGYYNNELKTAVVFHPVYRGLESYELEIYNRWGELIFKSTDPAVGWDGYINQQIAEMGVYVWKVKAMCTTGKMIVKAGDVTLIR